MTSHHDRQQGVIWISGYSAAGKTTVGRHVERLLNTEGHRIVFLDGDQLRAIFANKWDYTRDERIELAHIYFRLCSHLSKQGLIVIISAVAMFDEIRRWFKANIDNGMEVYLAVPLEERLRRDSKTKGIYSNASYHLTEYSEPESPDLVVNNYGEMTSEKAGRLITDRFLQKVNKTTADYGRREHWSTFYKKGWATKKQSPFAEYCIKHFELGKRVLEIGCGNGRDAHFFATNGYEVIGIDTSEPAITNAKKSNHHELLSYSCCDASQLKARSQRKFDYVYARFVLHAMTESEERSTLISAFHLLNDNGLLCIECRSINDPLSQKGEVISPTERIDGHYRRFVVLEELRGTVTDIGFSIIECAESTGWAVFQEEDPVVIRVICRRNDELRQSAD